MKKILSIILAVITALSFSTIAFAYENVDNTFDNFTPDIGTIAPDNWYDPLSYDENGLVTRDAFCSPSNSSQVAVYCIAHKKIFSITARMRTTDGKDYQPYRYHSFIYDNNYSYCPYCGETENEITCKFEESRHLYIGNIFFGYDCPTCGFHNIGAGDMKLSKGSPRDFICYAPGCGTWYCPENFYECTRYISTEQRTAPYGFIFEETAHMYGDGTDKCSDNLIQTAFGDFIRPEDDPYTQKTFMEKITDMIASITEWFSYIFNVIGGWFN